MPPYRYSDFWRDVGAAYAGDDPLGAVCWDGAPPWFNRFFARGQVRAIERAMGAEFRGGRTAGRALDLGCGTGRWTRWLERRCDEAVGVDISPGMLAAAGGGRYGLGDVTALPFADASFSLALSVTVLLHLPPGVQEAAVREAARVLRPGGSVVLLEMITPVVARDHIFPRPIAGWQALLSDAGLHPVRTEGEAFAPLLRLGFAAGGRGGRGGATSIDAAKKGGRGGASSSAIAGLRGPALVAARAAVAASYAIEPVAAAVLPDRAALNVCIVARKRA